MTEVSNRVLCHPPLGAGAYVDRWAAGLESVGVPVESMTLRNLIGSRSAVVHVHWPEHLVQSGPPHVVALRTIRTAVLLLVLFVQQNTVVWTAHNMKPHVGWRRIDRLVVAAFQRLLGGVVVSTSAHVEALKKEFPRLRNKQFQTIPLVALDPGVGATRPNVAPSGSVRLLQFGAVAPYRGQLLVVEALRDELEAGRCELTIVGRSLDEPYTSELRAAVSEVNGLTLHEGHVPDAELRQHMLDADAAVGVQVDGLNTGVLPAALPIGLPVISVSTMQSREIQEVVGEQWVFLLSAIANKSSWGEAIAWAGSDRESLMLPIFGVEENGRLHAEFYERLSVAR